MPSALALLWLMNSSSPVRCSTGRAPGFAPSDPWCPGAQPPNPSNSLYRSGISSAPSLPTSLPTETGAVVEHYGLVAPDDAAGQSFTQALLVVQHSETADASHQPDVLLLRFSFNVIAPIEQHHDWYGRIRPKPNSVDMSADIRLPPEGPCRWEKKG